MSFAAPEFRIPRQSVVGVEGEWCKMFDPPTESPATPELIPPNNPVPRFMRDTIPGVTMTILNTVRLTLLHGTDITMWDGNKVRFFTFASPDIPATAAGTYPAMTIRVPRGVLFHGWTHGEGPPPHTIHWHGIEPTAINDGVGHCSMEIGTYIYQWQPNFIGSYFYHCHRNTMQHFEFGLFGFLIVEPPNAYADPATAGTYPRRTAAATPGFPGFNPRPIARQPFDPGAMTVPYDVEALWVLDDVDSVWRTLGADARATFPKHGNAPGIDDEFHRNPGALGFFAFHDYNADYFFCTGVGFIGRVGATAAPLQDPAVVFGTPDGTVPAALNSGVAGMQVAVNARINQTILLRVLDAAYYRIRITFPIEITIIAFDGRALGVPPHGNYNAPFKLAAGQPFMLSTARRFDALVRSATPLPAGSFAQVEFFRQKDGVLAFTGRIPFNITA